MTIETVSVSFTCLKCGCETLSVEDEANDSSPVTCKGCGHLFCTYGELKASSMEKVKAAAQEALRNVFKGRKGWKLG